MANAQQLISERQACTCIFEKISVRERERERKTERERERKGHREKGRARERERERESRVFVSVVRFYYVRMYERLSVSSTVRHLLQFASFRALSLSFFSSKMSQVSECNLSLSHTSVVSIFRSCSRHEKCNRCSHERTLGHTQMHTHTPAFSS